ncbi:MAG: type II toxin-antitoxin system VapB family antitoxin [Azonexus sp.]|nr:type II toxin-antitoxin system VapB family antitoxin [Azonexus sp.]
MAIVIEDTQMENLARQIAAAEGVSISEVLRESLLSLAGLRGLTTPKAEPLGARLAALAREVDAIPARVPLDQRSSDEILGYNEYGAW